MAVTVIAECNKCKRGYVRVNKNYKSPLCVSHGCGGLIVLLNCPHCGNEYDSEEEHKCPDKQNRNYEAT